MASAKPTFDWNDLLLCIENRQVIPIIGRELLTVSLGDREILLDRYLAERLATRLDVRMEGTSNGPGLDAVATTFLGQGGDSNRICPTLVSIMEERPFAVPTSLAQLAAITDFPLFVSTTFDSLLCQALDKQRPGGLPINHCLVYAPRKNTTDRDYDLPPDWNGVDVYVHHLFGKLSTIAKDCAVTEEDYLEFISRLQSQEKRPVNLFDQYKKNHLLFLGCGFENWLERFFIRTVRAEPFSPSPVRTEIVADREAGRGGNLTVFLQLYRMQVYREGDPVQFVVKLHQLWCERNKKRKISPPSSAPPQVIGVFLSYASEDLQAAHNLYTALTAAGLDVWFDKAPGALRPGTRWNETILDGIERCAVFVPLLSHRAQRDTESYFRREWDRAIERSKSIDEETMPFILPVVRADDPPNPGEPGIRREFLRYQQSRLAEGQPSAEFVDRVKELVKERRKREGGYE